VALERRAWAEAAKLEPHSSRFPYAEAMTYFARALGASHIGETANGRSAVEALGEIRDRLTQAKETYWAEQVEIQRQGAAAWVAWADGRTSEALAGMRAAADREDLTEKSAVTPGPIAPARELLGDMLLEVKQPDQALKEYETTLKKEPNRFRALYGAAQAARQAGNVALAAKYNTQLVKVCERGDKPGRPELMQARRE
jgi:tetratricopeptide (TPR) repeat protein